MKILIEEIDFEDIKTLVTVLKVTVGTKEQLVNKLGDKLVKNFLESDFQAMYLKVIGMAETGQFKLNSQEIMQIGLLLSVFQKVLFDTRRITPKQIRRLNERLLNIFQPKEKEYYH